jgi:SAM-dependent methyltransferase
MVTIADPEALGIHDQLAADGLIAELESQARRALRNGRDPGAELEDGERYPSLPQWLALRGSTLALHPMQRPAAARLADGFSFEDLMAPRLDGISAAAALREQLGPRRAGVIVERQRAFCAAPMSEEARLLVGGAIDAQAVRRRSLIAAHTIATLGDRWDDGVRIACVGATGDGAAQLAAAVAGHAPELTLIGRDPMALVAAQVVAQARMPGLSVRAKLTRRGVVVALAELAATGGADVVDLATALGALPDGAAVTLLRAARHALRPGGVIVAANMLAERPQQTYLEHVVGWPSVVQRPPARLGELAAAAGFGDEQVALAIPAAAPAYAIATIDTLA